jgi:hypothetical protein
MTYSRNLSRLASVVVCLLFGIAGCAPSPQPAVKPQAPPEQILPVPAEEAQPAVKEQVAPQAEPGKETADLALKFTPGDTTTYKVISEAEQRVQWEGPLPPEPGFQGGRNHTRIEMTFTQRIQSVDDKGNAVAEITIGGVKYYAMQKDKVTLDFDNVTFADKEHPLAMIVGKSYTIELSPTGDVLRVIDANEARLAARRGSVIPVDALALLRPDTIISRHALAMLPPPNASKVTVGGKWSKMKDVAFGLMGSKSYEKVYTLTQVKETDGRKIAIAQMQAIPGPETPEELEKKRASGFSEMFDNTGEYTGQLEFDLTAGKVRKYSEDLKAEWVAVEQKEAAEPASLKMTATRQLSLDEID